MSLNPIPSHTSTHHSQSGGDDFESTHRKLSVPEAARYLGLSVSTLNKMRLNGTGPCFLKLGRRVLHDIRDLESWVRERKRRHTSEQA